MKKTVFVLSVFTGLLLVAVVIALNLFFGLCFFNGSVDALFDGIYHVIRITGGWC